MLFKTRIKFLGIAPFLLFATQFSILHSCLRGNGYWLAFSQDRRKQGRAVFTLNPDRLESTSSILPEPPILLHGDLRKRKHGPIAGPFWNLVQMASRSSEVRSRAGSSQNRKWDGTPHREVIVEILSKLEPDPLADNYDRDNFPGDLGSAQPAWSVVVEHGAISAVKSQLGPDTKSMFRAAQVMTVLTDSTLNASGKVFQWSRDVQVLSPESNFTITNTGQFPVRFI